MTVGGSAGSGQGKASSARAAPNLFAAAAAARLPRPPLGGEGGGRARAREPLGAGAAAGSRCLAPSPSPSAGKGRRGGEPLLPRGGPTASGAAVGQSTCFQLQRLGGAGRGGGWSSVCRDRRGSARAGQVRSKRHRSAQGGLKGAKPRGRERGQRKSPLGFLRRSPSQGGCLSGEGEAIPAGAGREAATFPTSSFPDLQAQALEEPPSQSSGSSAGSLARLPSAALTPPCPAWSPTGILAGCKAIRAKGLSNSHPSRGGKKGG